LKKKGINEDLFSTHAKGTNGQIHTTKKLYYYKAINIDLISIVDRQINKILINGQ